MKKIIKFVVLIIIVMFLVACSSRLSNEELSRQVANHINETWAQDEMFSGLKVSNVILVNTDGNNYSGVAKVVDKKGESANLDVTVIYDGKYFQWEISDDSLENLLQLNW